MRAWGLSRDQQEEVWYFWRRGHPVRSVALCVGKPETKVWRYLLVYGGHAPVLRHRGAPALTVAEREEISRGVVAGESCRRIATRLGRAPSTVSREVARNGGPPRYRATRADAAARRRAERPKPARLASHAALRAVVERKLEQRWSPKQIAHWLPRAYPDDPTMRR
jgi:transposase